MWKNQTNQYSMRVILETLDMEGVNAVNFRHACVH